MRRAAVYARVSSLDQNPGSHLLDLEQLAKNRGLEIVETYIDHGISGTRVRRPALDKLMQDASRHHFDIVLVWAFDRLARSVRHLLETLDELHRLDIEFVSVRENIDTGGPLGRALMVIVGAIGELERSLIVERVGAGMRRAKFEGRHIGRKPLDADRTALCRDRQRGMSLGQLAKAYRISRTSVTRILNNAAARGVSEGVSPSSPQLQQNRRRETAA